MVRRSLITDDKRFGTFDIIGRNARTCVSSNSMLRITFFVVLPSLLLSPILYYSLTTPFALVDDYGTWYYLSKLDSFSSFFRWVNGSFLHFNDPHERYRPLWDIYNALAWKGFGPTPWAHHLSRWVFHFGAVLTFVAAFRRVSSPRQEPGQRDGIERLLPPAFLVYVWLFFPNSPASRLGPQEVLTVFFLGLCTWMTALMLSGRDKSPSAHRPPTLLHYALFYLSYAGLCWSKEINVAVALWILVFYYVVLVSRAPLGWKRRTIMGGIPLALIFFYTVGMVYAASTISGVGYGNRHRDPTIIGENATRVLEGLFQVETSLLITVGFALLSATLLCTVVIRVVRTELFLDTEIVFVLFLLGSFVSTFLILSLSWNVVLRYWYPLIPVFAMLLAFSVKFILAFAGGRSITLARTATVAFAGFLVFFVAVNYYNFSFQTVIQHSLRHAESRLRSEMFRLLDRGEYVQVEETGIEYEHKLIHDIVPFQQYYDYDDNRGKVHTAEPDAGRHYYFVTRRNLPVVGDDVVAITNEWNYRLLSYASGIAGALQGTHPSLAVDAGVFGFDRDYHYQWNVYGMTSGELKLAVPSAFDELLIRSEYEVYVNRKTNRLLYLKKPCREEDTRARFFLHVWPVDAGDTLPPSTRAGHENADFFFNEYGMRYEGTCTAVRELPDWDIAYVRTGQFTDEGRIWDAEFSFDE